MQKTFIMRTLNWILLVILLGTLVIACEDANTNTETAAPEADAMTMKETPAEETAKPIVDDAKYIELAEKWRLEVDEALGQTIDKAVHEYSCDGWGGSLTLGQDGAAIVYREHLNGGDDGAVWTRFYSPKKDITDLYNEDNEVVIVWTLSKMFAGDNATSEETIFYLREGNLLDAIQRKAEGTTATIDNNLAAAEYVKIKGDAISDYQVQYRDLLEMDIENIQAYFCE